MEFPHSSRFGRPTFFTNEPVSELSGLAGLWVYPLIDRFNEPLCPVSEQRVRTIAELKLRATGVPVISSRPLVEADAVTQVPWLQLSLAWLFRPDAKEYVYTCSLEVLEPGTTQRVAPRADPLRVLVFGRHTMVGVCKEAGADVEIVKRIDELLDVFLNEWLRANPRS